LKIHCECGQPIVDFENRTGKAHLIPDEGYSSLLEAIDQTIESSGSGISERDVTCMKVRGLLTQSMRTCWQCSACSRMYVEMPDRTLQCFTPSAAASARGALGTSRK